MVSCAKTRYSGTGMITDMIPCKLLSHLVAALVLVVCNTVVLKLLQHIGFKGYSENISALYFMVLLTASFNGIRTTMGFKVSSESQMGLDNMSCLREKILMLSVI